MLRLSRGRPWYRLIRRESKVTQSCCSCSWVLQKARHDFFIWIFLCLCRSYILLILCFHFLLCSLMWTPGAGWRSGTCLYASSSSSFLFCTHLSITELMEWVVSLGEPRVTSYNMVVVRDKIHMHRKRGGSQPAPSISI